MEKFFSSGIASAKPSANSSAMSANISPWVEKYRPRSIDDIVQQEEVVAVLREAISTGDLPNLLFYGPPGTGKTSTILAVAHQMFGREFRERVLELNASDERGIAVIRDKVKTYAQNTAKPLFISGKPCPGFKIIILDEADSLTPAAQAALRRTMEKHAKATRFCLICNYVSRIIDPITSRCAKFRFAPLHGQLAQQRLHDIAAAEKVNCENEALEALREVADGDLRRAITLLQSSARLASLAALVAAADRPMSVDDDDDVDAAMPPGPSGNGSSVGSMFDMSGQVTAKLVHHIAATLPEDYAEALWNVAGVNNMDQVRCILDEVINDGYPATQVLLRLSSSCLEKDQFTDLQKSLISERIAVTEKRLLDGADEYVQLLALFSFIGKAVSLKTDRVPLDQLLADFYQL